MLHEYSMYPVSTLPVSRYLACLTVYYSYVLYFFICFICSTVMLSRFAIYRIHCVCYECMTKRSEMQTNTQTKCRKAKNLAFRHKNGCAFFLCWNDNGMKRGIVTAYCFVRNFVFRGIRSETSLLVVEHNFFKFDSLRFRFLFVRWVRYVVSREINALLLCFYAKHIGKGLKSLRRHNLNITNLNCTRRASSSHPCSCAFNAVRIAYRWIDLTPNGSYLQFTAI